MKNQILCGLLRAVSIKPGAPRYASSLARNNLSQLEAMYPDFVQEAKDKRIVDFGCGAGYQSLALAQIGSKRVVGIEVYEPHVASARLKAKEMGVDKGVHFTTKVESEHLHQFDMVLSHNSMEHFADPAATLKTIKSLAKPDGRIFITFGPLWYSVYGAHTNFFCLFPWIHLIFPEAVVMAVRASYTDDKAKHYEDVRGGLNRITRKKFLRFVELAGLEVVYRKEMYMAGLNWLCNIPLLRELCLYHMSVILRLRPEK